MRNYELIQRIYKICMTADYRDEGRAVPEVIANLIQKERPQVMPSVLREQEHDLTSCGDNPHGD